jgi:hypothetical protein
VQRYASVDASLYRAILNRCVEANKMCMDDMMAIDAKAAWANRAASTWRSPADADRAGFHHRSWPQVRCVHVQRCHPGNRLSRRELEQILMNDTFDLTKFIFGRLSWGIDSLYDPIIMATLVVVLGGLGLVAAMTYYRSGARCGMTG